MARQRTNETAFVVDEERVGAAADGTYFAGLPGLWRPGEAVHPEALGLTVEEMRDVVRELDLPVVEVKVPEDSALRSFRPADDRAESSPAPIGGAHVPSTDPAADVEGPTIGEDVQMARTLLDATDASDEERAAVLGEESV